MFKTKRWPAAVCFEDIETTAAHDGRVRNLFDPLYRVALAIGFRIARLVWRLTRPRHQGALVAILVGRSMLLLRQSYRPELSMPGGGIAPGEDPAMAASRELAEELDLHVSPAELRQVHVQTGLWDGRRDTVTFFELELAACPVLRLDNREVVAATLVAFDAINPADVTPAVGAYVTWRRRCLAAAAAEPAECGLALVRAAQ